MQKQIINRVMLALTTRRDNIEVALRESLVNDSAKARLIEEYKTARSIIIGLRCALISIDQRNAV